MLVKIPVNQLEVGMYVAQTGLSWEDSTRLYAVEGLIAFQEEVQAIREDGYIEAVVDTEKGTAPASASEPVGGQSRGAACRTAQPQPTPLLQEVKVARQLQREALNFIKTFARTTTMGRLPDLEASRDLVGRMIDSVSRNADALLGLSKLRSTDEYTFCHCLNVSVLAIILGRYIEVDGDQLMQLGLAGLMHDLGKFDIPLEVLNKKGKLTDEEFAVMKQHPRFGHERLAEVNGIPPEILPGVLHHHERFDGKGYPEGLSGEEISFVAQIIGLADVYDALTSRRVYKPAMPPAKAMSLMYSMRGQNFSPEMLEYFVCCLGVYPIGSYVQLSDGRFGVVRDSPALSVTRPMVRIIQDAKGRALPPRDVDLAEHEHLKVAKVLDAAEHGIDPSLIILS